MGERPRHPSRRWFEFYQSRSAHGKLRARQVRVSTFVIFRVGDRACALAQADVSRVTPIAALARPPTAPPLVCGFLNLGGQALPILDAAALFGVTSAPGIDPLYRHVLIVRGSLGILVDRVIDVRPLDLSEAKPPGEGASLNGCVAALLTDSGEAISLLDASRLLTKAERDRLDQLIAMERVRLDQWAPS
jgi:purine-binding chemotaxis protein CheW